MATDGTYTEAEVNAEADRLAVLDEVQRIRDLLLGLVETVGAA